MRVYFAQVGAPPEIAHLLEGIRQETDLCNRHAVTTCLGADPELDEFMVTSSSFSFSFFSINKPKSLFCFAFVNFMSLVFRKRTAICW